MEITVEINDKKLQRALRLFPFELRAQLADAMDHSTRSFYKNFYKKRLRGRPGVKSTRGGLFHRFRRIVLIDGKPSFLSLRGNQAETTALIGETSSDPLDIKVEMYSKSKAAKVHEEGGTLHPQSGGAFLIPVSAEAKALAKASISPAANSQFIPLKIKGKLYLVKVNKRDKTVTIHYIFRRTITIPRRLGYYNTWDSQESRRMNIFNKAVDNALESF